MYKKPLFLLFYRQINATSVLNAIIDDNEFSLALYQLSYRSLSPIFTILYRQFDNPALLVFDILHIRSQVSCLFEVRSEILLIYSHVDYCDIVELICLFSLLLEGVVNRERSGLIRPTLTDVVCNTCGERRTALILT